VSDYGKLIRKILSEAGCEFRRHGKGDHDIWYSPIVDYHITVDKKIKSATRPTQS
jgi:hypothetical protein